MSFNILKSLLGAMMALVALFSLLSCTAQYALNPKLEVHVAFASLPDKAEREYFQEIPTALTLPAEQVDKLREVAGRLLYEQEPFKKLVTDLGGKMPETGPPK